MLAEEQINDSIVEVTLKDLMSSTLSIMHSDLKLQNLTDTMKQELISGVINIRNAVAIPAYSYYRNTEFEDTPDIIPLMRSVVEGYAQSGGRLPELRDSIV